MTKAKLIKAFSLVIIKILALAGNPAAAVAVKGVEKFTEVILKLTSNKEPNMWVAIEGRLDSRIDDKITHNHFGTLVHLVNKLQEYMQPGIQITEKDLRVHILTMKEQFLPQTFSYTSFNSKWATAFPAYLTYMTAAYLDLVSQGKLDECGLAEELQEIRNETIQAAKALFRARFRNLNGVASYMKWPKGCKGAHCSFVQWLEYEDSATGQRLAAPMTGVESLFWSIQDHTKEIVWNQLVQKVNYFFSEDICTCAGKCPKPIEKKEVVWMYSRGCYGVSEDNKYKCTLPCHAYDDGYNWCPAYKHHIIPRHNNLYENWQYCKKDKYFLKCMPVKGTTVFEK